MRRPGLCLLVEPCFGPPMSRSVIRRGSPARKLYYCAAAPAIGRASREAALLVPGADAADPGDRSKARREGIGQGASSTTLMVRCFA